MNRIFTVTAMVATLVIGQNVQGQSKNFVPVEEWYVVIGPTTGDLLQAMEEGIHIEKVREWWDEQQSMLRQGEILELSDTIAKYLPFRVSIDATIISIPGYADGRRGMLSDEVGGWVNMLLMELSRRGAEYEIVGNSALTLYDVIPIDIDGELANAEFKTKEFIIEHQVEETEDQENIWDVRGWPQMGERDPVSKFPPTLIQRRTGDGGSGLKTLLRELLPPPGPGGN